MKAYIFIQRYSGNKFVREWHYRWPDEAFGSGGPNPTSDVTAHPLWDPCGTAREMARGWLHPAQSGLVQEDRDVQLYHIYVDDLYVCPLCGRFWIDEMKDDLRKLHHTLAPDNKVRLAQLRHTAAEFSIRLCPGKCIPNMVEAFEKQMKKERKDASKTVVDSLALPRGSASTT